MKHLKTLCGMAMPVLLLVFCMSPILLTSRKAYPPSVTVCDSDSIAKPDTMLPILHDKVDNGL